MTTMKEAKDSLPAMKTKDHGNGARQRKALSTGYAELQEALEIIERVKRRFGELTLENFEQASSVDAAYNALVRSTGAIRNASGHIKEAKG